MKRKRPFTLLEIMIVIFLIGLIGSVIGYNMKGTMSEGKAFKTEQAISKLKDIFELELAKGASIENIRDYPHVYLANSKLVSDPKTLLKDGWGRLFTLKIEDDELQIISEKYLEYKNTKIDYELDDEENQDDQGG